MFRRLEVLLKGWFVAPSSGIHLDVADGLRGLAILLVVCAHGFYFNPDGPRLLAIIGSFLSTGWVGVPIFFVLSGFLISLPFFRSRLNGAEFVYPRGYATRRILKIIPPFYLVIAILALFYFFRYRDNSYFRIGAAWATGIAHFKYIPQYFNTSFWSLWVEVGFYVLLPILFFAIRRASIRVAGWTIFSILLILPFVSRSLTWPYGADAGELAFVMRRFPSSLSNFGWGVLFSAIYVSISRQPDKRRFARFGYAGMALLGLSCGLFAAMVLKSPPGSAPGRLQVELSSLLPGVSAFLLLFFAFDPSCSGARLFCSGKLRFLGIVSYEWFLLHQPVQMQVRELAVNSHGNLLRYLLVVVTPSLLTLALAALIYHRFSLPILRFGRAKLKNDRSVRPIVEETFGRAADTAGHP